MKDFLEKIMVALVMISLISSAVLLWQRVQAESELNQVAVYVDYYELEQMAEQSEHDLEWWLGTFRELGATHAVLQEESLGLYRQQRAPMKVEVGTELKKEWNWEETVPPALQEYHETEGIDDFDVVVMTEDPELFRQMERGVESRYEEEKVSMEFDPQGSYLVFHGSLEDAVYSPQSNLTDFQGETYYQERRVHSSQLYRLGLGYKPEKIQTIQKAGLQVMPRPSSYPGWTGEKYLEGYLQDLKEWDMIPEMLFFTGRELPGYRENGLERLEPFFRQHEIRVGLIETAFQRQHLEMEGSIELAERLEYDSVRVFNMWPFVQERYQYYQYEGAEEIENTLYRAVTERNISAIYFKPFKETPTMYVTDPDEYHDIFDRFETRIDRHGFSLGEASSLPQNNPSRWLQLIASVGVLAAAGLFVKKMIPVSNAFLGSGIVLAGLMLFSLYGVRPPWAEKLTALGAAVMYPMLAIWIYCQWAWKWMRNSHHTLHYGQALWNGVVMLLVVSAISMGGALTVAALLSDTHYLMELDIFRGVKISQLLPLFGYAMVFLYFFGYQRQEDALHTPGIRPSEIIQLLMENVKVLYALAAGGLLAAGYIYLARTGHESGLTPMEIEMVLRNVLEERLLVRPRTKEFLVAFPALVLSAYVASLRIKSLLFVAGLAAVIGQTSIVNTFTHLRTPFMVSVVRTGFSLVASFLMSALYLAILMGVCWMVKHWGTKIWKQMEKAG